MKYLRPTQNYTHYYTGSSTTKTAQPIQRATHKNVGHKNVGDERDDSVSKLERERERVRSQFAPIYGIMTQQ